MPVAAQGWPAVVSSLLVAVLLSLLGSAASGSGLPDRHAAVNPCSLYGTDSCGIESYLGVGTASGLAGALMLPGEIDCVVALHGCRNDKCYSFRDATAVHTQQQQQQQDPFAVAAASQGFFKQLTAVNGTRSARRGGDGSFAFKADDSGLVVLRYSTQTCNDFYATRGRIGVQDCRAPTEVVTPLHTGSLLDLPC